MRLLLLGLVLLLGACAARPPAAVSAQRETLVMQALAQVGKPYRYGAVGPEAFDCSGLVQYVYGQAGIRLPRSTLQQFRSGEAIPADRARTGDLLFYRFDGKQPGPSHVVIYLGEGEAVHAPASGSSVRAARIDNPAFEQRLVGARRVME